MGKPVPLQVTVAVGAVPETVHPEISRLAGLMIAPTLPGAICMSFTASGILSAQSPAKPNEQWFPLGRHVHHRRAGHAPVRVAHVVALAFIRAKEKRLVLDQAPPKLPPNCSSVRVSFGFGIGIEIVARVQGSVAAKHECAAVQVVGAGLQSHIHDCSRLPAVFRRRILLQVEFLNRVNRKNRRRVSGDARSVHDGLAGVGLAVEQAFDVIRVVFGAQAVGAGGGKSAAGITHDAGTQLQQILVVTATQRQDR